MQLLEILEGFSPPELKKLEQQLKEGNRTQSYQLFRELKKCIDGKMAYDHELVFSEVFKEPYSTVKSYLLKNELRKLKKTVQSFLVNLHVERRIKEDPEFFTNSLMQELAARKVKGVFEAEIEQQIKKADNPKNLDALIALMRQKMNYHKWANYTSIEEYQQFLNDYRNALIRRMLLEVRYVEVELVRNARMVNYKSKRSAYKEDNYEVDLLQRFDTEDYDSDYTQFLKMKIESIGMQGEPKLEKDLEILAFVEAREGTAFVGYEEVKILLQEIIDWCQLLNRDKEANRYFDQYLNQIYEQQADISDTDHHYITLKLVTLGRNQEAVDYFSKHEASIKKAKKKLIILHTVAYAFVFLNHPKGALLIINEYFTGSDITAQATTIDRMKRLLYTILFLMDNDVDGATREWQNYKRSQAYKEVKSPVAKEVIKYFEQYLNILSGNPAQVKKLTADLLEEATAYNNKLKTFLFPLVWLMQHMNKKLDYLPSE